MRRFAPALCALCLLAPVGAHAAGAVSHLVGRTPATVSSGGIAASGAQHCAAAVSGGIDISSHTCSMPGAPTVGNTMYAACSAQDGLPGLGSGWTNVDSINGSGNGAPYTRWVKRAVQSGDTASETPCTVVGNNFKTVTVWEMAGTPTLEVLAKAQADQPVLTFAPLNATVTGNTAASNDFAVMTGHQSRRTSAAGSNELFVNNSYGTPVESYNPTGDFHGSVIQASKSITTSGSAYTVTLNLPTASQNNGGITVGVLVFH